MTPEAQRIAIATACGWKRFPPKSDVAWGADADKNKYWMFVHQLPDYLDNLNAAHEMEKVLTDSQKIDYQIQLYMLLDLGGFPMHGDEGHLTPMGCFILIHATAAKRAEAFLRALGLWQEEPKEQLV